MLADRLDGRLISAKILVDLENAGDEQVQHLNIALDELMKGFEKKFG